MGQLRLATTGWLYHVMTRWEQTNHFQNERIEVVLYTKVKNLKYLQATIDEGLRMFATNSFGLPRVVPKCGVIELGGRTFGEGVSTFRNALLQRVS